MCVCVCVCVYMALQFSMQTPYQRSFRARRALRTVRMYTHNHTHTHTHTYIHTQLIFVISPSLYHHKQAATWDHVRASLCVCVGVSRTGCYVYGRSFNPTVRALAKQLAALEDTEAAYATSSGECVCVCVCVVIAEIASCGFVAPDPTILCVLWKEEPTRLCVCVCVCAGMAAISCALMALCNAGDHIVASNTVYGKPCMHT